MVARNLNSSVLSNGLSIHKNSASFLPSINRRRSEQSMKRKDAEAACAHLVNRQDFDNCGSLGRNYGRARLGFGSQAFEELLFPISAAKHPSEVVGSFLNPR
jgi:hypothetical protein